jgi:hypothetical protein
VTRDARSPGTAATVPGLPHACLQLVHRAGLRQLHRAVEDLAGVGEVDVGVRPRRDVGEDEPARTGAVGVFPGFAAVEVQGGDVLLAVREGRLAQEEVGPVGEGQQRVAGAGVAGVRERGGSPGPW